MAIDLTLNRPEFLQGGLSLDELNADPIKQFELWFKQAIEAGVIEPSAMSLATSDGLEVSLRTVLLKFFDDKRFCLLYQIMLQKNLNKLSQIHRLHYCFRGWRLNGK